MHTLLWEILAIDIAMGQLCPFVPTPPPLAKLQLTRDSQWCFIDSVLTLSNKESLPSSLSFQLTRLLSKRQVLIPLSVHALGCAQMYVCSAKV